MARRGRPKAPVVLADQERQTLERWARGRKSADPLAVRSRIILEASTGATNQNVAAKVGVNPATVVKWRQRFVGKGLDGLVDEPRSGAPRRISEVDVDWIIMKTLTDKPKNAARWSTRELSKETGISAASVRRIWQVFGLRPWVSHTLEFSNDPLFSEKIRDIVGLYFDPPEKAVVLCVDEHPILPVSRSKCERGPNDQSRHRVTSLLAVLKAASGQITGGNDGRQRISEFEQFLATIEEAVPGGFDVHVVVDNASTHAMPMIQSWLAGHPRFYLHVSPSSSSWLNLVDGWFAELIRRLLPRAPHPSMAALESDLGQWIGASNENLRAYGWHKIAEEIRETLG
jgi:transposase